jgi:DNA-directed RNA polymerase subunit RPC12/RpoP
LERVEVTVHRSLGVLVGAAVAVTGEVAIQVAANSVQIPKSYLLLPLAAFALAVAAVAIHERSSSAPADEIAPVDMPCPYCGFPVMQVHGRKRDNIFLNCGRCSRTVKATQKDGEIVKLLIVGIGAVIGTEVIDHYLRHNPDSPGAPGGDFGDLGDFF